MAETLVSLKKNKGSGSNIGLDLEVIAEVSAPGGSTSSTQTVTIDKAYDEALIVFVGATSYWTSASIALSGNALLDLELVSDITWNKTQVGTRNIIYRASLQAGSLTGAMSAGTSMSAFGFYVLAPRED